MCTHEKLAGKQNVYEKLQKCLSVSTTNAFCARANTESVVSGTLNVSTTLSASITIDRSGVVTLGNFSCKLSRNFVLPSWYKLHGSLSSVTCHATFLLQSVARSRAEFYFSQRVRQPQRDMIVSGRGVAQGNDPCNLCRNKIARQVVRKIA